MVYHTLTTYFPRPLALASYSTLQELVKIPWSIIRRFYNADIVEALHGAIEEHYVAFVRGVADMQRAPRRASLGRLWMSWRGMWIWGMNAGMSSERQGDGGLVGRVKGSDNRK